MRANKGQTSLRGRNAETGHFIPVEEARRNPNTTTVERVPKPGYGAESSSPRGRDVKTGEFIPVEEAKRRPNTTVVERVRTEGKANSTMPYEPRIPVDREYVVALGRALYNFTYPRTAGDLDDRQGEPGTATGPFRPAKRRSSSRPRSTSPSTRRRRHWRAVAQVAHEVSREIPPRHLYEEQAPAWSPIHKHWVEPNSSGSGGHEWTIDKIDDAAKHFEDVAIEGNDVYYDQPLAERH